MVLKGICLTFFGLGIFLLVQVAMPLLAFKAWEVFAIDQDQLLATPQAGAINFKEKDVLGVSIESVGDFPAFVSHDPQAEAPYPEFKISVPSINLNDIVVKTNSNNFDQTLAQLPGTAFPGEKGNLFISGHSSVIENFQLHDKKALFVNLPKIKKGDTITVSALGQDFIYRVQGLKVVDPKDVSVIRPPDNTGRYLTLMTCVPPGFNAKRLVVLAELTSGL